jgi:predicted kinase
MMILVCGLPGSGKSFFASRLANRLKADYISSDRVRIALLATGRYSFEDKLRIYRHMAERAATLVKRGKDVVVDATFYHHSMRELFIEVALQNQCAVRFIVIMASEALVKERLSRSRIDSEADLGVYQTMKAQFEKFTQPHLRLQAQADNIEQMLLAAIDYLIDTDGKR